MLKVIEAYRQISFIYIVQCRAALWQMNAFYKNKETGFACLFNHYLGNKPRLKLLFSALKSVQALAHCVPINHVPPSFKIVGAFVLVPKVICVFPDIITHYNL